VDYSSLLLRPQNVEFLELKVQEGAENSGVENAGVENEGVGSRECCLLPHFSYTLWPGLRGYISRTGGPTVVTKC